jgi:hypothetical protein
MSKKTIPSNCPFKASTGENCCYISIPMSGHKSEQVILIENQTMWRSITLKLGGCERKSINFPKFFLVHTLLLRKCIFRAKSLLKEGEKVGFKISPCRFCQYLISSKYEEIK